MLEKEITTKCLSAVGEEISHELGAKMVKDFQDANPGKATGSFIGREILEKILAQPDCQGIDFYNAINETGRNTLVYVGVDASNNVIASYTVVNPQGEFIFEKGIVADRSIPPGGLPPSDCGWWL